MIRVILRDTVRGLGKRGEIVDVSDGYARNFLLPQGLAMRSSAGAERQASVMRKSREVKDARDRAVAEDVAKTLAPMVVTVEARASREGRLFGSISANDIADAVYRPDRLRDRPAHHRHGRADQGRGHPLGAGPAPHRRPGVPPDRGRRSLRAVAAPDAAATVVHNRARRQAG